MNMSTEYILQVSSGIQVFLKYSSALTCMFYRCYSWIDLLEKNIILLVQTFLQDMKPLANRNYQLANNRISDQDVSVDLVSGICCGSIPDIVDCLLYFCRPPYFVILSWEICYVVWLVTSPPQNICNLCCEIKWKQENQTTN